ncbi:hypothetical protein KIH87_10595 [Paraneptunicella aestuarii]|uniref:condensation domain-containing protein n=1 Tax=Paraneptunicella aestuarii TaxID=2831148 RepID=UPI001E40FC5E|nr:condensation domain-containing protein [Paraneptunicella aestuarii]UAA37197.1 hypothetical protein KIH87_10595 [Paraneptunicella aestuarii]
MNTREIMEYCKQNGIVLGVVDGKLKLHAPDDKLNKELLDNIRNKKKELLNIFKQSEYFTVSDFPNARLSQQAWEQIKHQYPDFYKLYIATPLQTEMWFRGIGKQNRETCVTQYCYEVSGELEPVDVLNAWQSVVNRHDILRTGFVETGPGSLHQFVYKTLDVISDYTYQMPRWCIDWSSVDEGQQEQLWKQFKSRDKAQKVDLSKPLLTRLRLIKTGKKHSYLIFTYPYFLMDEWCISVLLNELLDDVGKSVVGKVFDSSVALPYEEHIHWLLQQDPGLTRKHWQKHLNRISLPTLLAHPIDDIEKELPASWISSISFSSESTKKLQALAHEHCTALGTILHAAWAVILRHYCGGTSVVYGGVFPCKSLRLEGNEKMLGQFVNLVPVLIDFSGVELIKHLLDVVHEGTLKCQEYSCLPLSEVLAYSGLTSDEPLFDSLLIFENSLSGYKQPQASNLLPGFSIENLEPEYLISYPVIIRAQLLAEELSVRFTFDAEFLTEDKSKKLSKQFEQVLKRLSEGHQSDLVSSLVGAEF